MVVSSAFVSAKIEALLVSNTASSSMSATAVLPGSARARRAVLMRRNLGMIRCEAAPEALAQVDHVEPTNVASFSVFASSLSALEHLKASTADTLGFLMLVNCESAIEGGNELDILD